MISDISDVGDVSDISDIIPANSLELKEANYVYTSFTGSSRSKQEAVC